MNYKIEKLERKTTSTGKAMIKATVQDNLGATTPNVAIWSSFPRFADLKEGDVVEGDIKTQVNGNFTNHTLNPKSSAAGPIGGFKGNPGAITKAMETKRENIQESQERKDLSIKISSTMRDAVLLATTEYTHNQDRSLDELVVKWRHWLFLQWDKTDPSSIAPF